MEPQRCGLRYHNVGKYGEAIKVHPRYLKSLRQFRPDFDESDTVCADCYNAFKKALQGKPLKRKKLSSVINEIRTSSESISTSTDLDVLPSSSSSSPSSSCQMRSSARKHNYISTVAPIIVNDSSSDESSTPAAKMRRESPIMPSDSSEGQTTSAAAERNNERALVTASAKSNAPRAKENSP